MAEFQNENTSEDEQIDDNAGNDVREDEPEEDFEGGGDDGGWDNADEDDWDSLDDGDDDVPENRAGKKRKKRLIIAGITAAVIAALVVVSAVGKIVKNNAAKKDMYVDTAVERRTIKKSITGSSSTEPNDSYNVTTIKSGDITADYFKEGDTVKKGDKLYQFDDEDARNSLSTAQNALTKAEQSYVDSVKQRAQTISANNIATKSSQNAITKSLNSLTDARDSYDDQFVRSDISGKVAEVSVKEGDTVSNGMTVATVYNDRYMKIRLPFNDFDAENVYVGAAAEVTVSGSGDDIYGTVTEKSSDYVATEMHTTVVYVTIEVTNPGALTENDVGSAVVNGVACADTANFEYMDTQKITAKTAGAVESVSISEGDAVYSGQQVAYIDSSTASTTLKNAELSYDDAVLNLQKQVLQNDTYSQDSAIKNAQLALDDAKINLRKAEDAVKDYVVEAPIDGTVVKKNAKNGDTRESTNNSEALCVIYDLSSLKVSIEIDETEIALVKTGLKANITADAVEGTFEGEVTKVPVDGVNENGVTTYTIEIQVTEYGDLLPGMNVDVEIIVDEADDVLTIPVNSVNRGDIVFVRNDGQPHENDVTDIINNRNGDGAKKGAGKDADNGADKDTGRDSGSGAGDQPRGGQDASSADAGAEDARIPVNIEVPEGYRAIRVETGLNDTDYIEIKSGLSEDDMVRTLNTESSSAGASFGDDDMMMQMQQQRNAQMHQMQTGGGMGGPGGGGGMGGGPR